jgi:hypothetical protein
LPTGQGFGGDHGAQRPKQAKIDEEYMSLMAELGEGPPPSAEKDRSADTRDNRPPWQQQQSRSGPGMFGGGRGGGAPKPLMGPDHGHQRNDFGGERGQNNQVSML